MLVLLSQNAQSYPLAAVLITPFGCYAFRRLPFGIWSVPEIFQRKMLSLLEGLSEVEVIMDDILVHGRDLDEHDACLTAVIRRIDASIIAGLKLNPSKCVLRQSEPRRSDEANNRPSQSRRILVIGPCTAIFIR